MNFESFTDTYLWRSEVVEVIFDYEVDKTWIEPALTILLLIILAWICYLLRMKEIWEGGIRNFCGTVFGGSSFHEKEEEIMLPNGHHLLRRHFMCRKLLPSAREGTAKRNLKHNIEQLFTFFQRGLLFPSFFFLTPSSTFDAFL